MINTLEKLFIAVIGAVSVLFIYGMLSMAWACGDCGPPTRFTLHITTNSNLEQDNDTFPTYEECEKEGAYRLYLGKIRDFYCW